MGVMLQAALADELREMPPETKYLLLRIVQRTEAGLAIPGPARALSQLVALDERKVSKALKELLAAGTLKSAASRINAPGRPVVRYTLATAYRHGLRNRNVSIPVHHAAIEELLKHERGREIILQDRQCSTKPYAVSSIEAARALRVIGRLTVVNRLVLAVMLSRADRFGRVCLGRLELSKLTGLTSTKLKNRIDTLLDAGLIRAYVPGATGTLLFKKTVSVYFLNLNHPELGSGKCGPTLLVSVARYVDDNNEYTQADYSFLAAKQKDWRLRYRGVHRFFTPKHEIRIRHLFQSNLDRYAGYLLSNHWGAERQNASVLADIIKEDLLERQFGEQEFPTVGDQHMLIEYLCEEAVALANNFKSDWFERRDPNILKFDFSAMEYVLLPLSKAKIAKDNYFYPSRAVLALPRDGSSAKHELYIIESVPVSGDLSQKIMWHDTDPEKLPSEELGLYGLRTRPKMVVRIASSGELDWV